MAKQTMKKKAVKRVRKPSQVASAPVDHAEKAVILAQKKLEKTTERSNKIKEQLANAIAKAKETKRATAIAAADRSRQSLAKAREDKREAAAALREVKASLRDKAKEEREHAKLKEREKRLAERKATAKAHALAAFEKKWEREWERKQRTRKTTKRAGPQRKISDEKTKTNNLDKVNTEAAVS